MTCKRIAKLLSEKQEHELSFFRRLAITVHLSWCVFCRRLSRQLLFIHGLSHAIGDAADESPLQQMDAALPAEAKSRMKKILAQKNS